MQTSQARGLGPLYLSCSTLKALLHLDLRVCGSVWDKLQGTAGTTAAQDSFSSMGSLAKDVVEND